MFHIIYTATTTTQRCHDRLIELKVLLRGTATICLKATSIIVVVVVVPKVGKDRVMLLLHY